MTKTMNTSITFRVTKEQRDIIDDLTQGASISDFIKNQLFAENANVWKKKKTRPVRDLKQLCQLLALLGETDISNQLRILVEEAKNGNLVLTEEVEICLKTASVDIRNMKNALLQALGYQG